MSEMKKIATRESCGNALVELGRLHEDVVVLDADLAGATKSGIFKKAFPERHFNCGIAEADMIGVAAGLSTMGYVPFAQSFAMFAAGRAYEQLRNTVGYPHLNVKVCATHGGISVGEDGASYQCCEDFAVYMRLGRLAVEQLYTDCAGFAIGKGRVLREGGDVAIIATGLMVQEAVRAAEVLAGEGVSARVIDMCTIKPLDEELVLAAARDCGRIVTCEEHSVIGGLGEAVCSCLSEHCPVPVARLCVNDEYGHSGPGAELLREFKLSCEGICEKVRALCGK